MLLDTDILIDALRGNEKARNFLQSLPDDPPHCCSAITVAELHSGMRETEREKTTELIESLLALPVTKEIAEMAGKFRRERRNTGADIGTKGTGKAAGRQAAQKPESFDLELDDCLIAATAVAEGLELATKNTRHYPMPEVRIRPAAY